MTEQDICRHSLLPKKTAVFQQHAKLDVLILSNTCNGDEAGCRHALLRHQSQTERPLICVKVEGRTRVGNTVRCCKMQTTISSYHTDVLFPAPGDQHPTANAARKRQTAAISERPIALLHDAPHRDCRSPRKTLDLVGRSYLSFTSYFWLGNFTPAYSPRLRWAALQQ